MGIKTILVVDDNEGDQLLAQITIEKFNQDIAILTAQDGVEALEILSSSLPQPDVILLDINMPRMGGHEFLEHYKTTEDPSHVVVMLTSSDDAGDKAKCQAYPFVKQYLNKSISVEKLGEIESSLHA